MHTTLLSAATLVSVLAVVHVLPGDDDDASERHVGRSVPAFDRVQVSGIFVFDIAVGPDHSVLLHGDSDDLEHVRTRVRNGRLEVSLKDYDRKWGDRSRIRVTITAPDIQRIDLSGVVKGRAHGFNTEKLEVDMSGASKVQLEGRVGRLSIDVSGAAKVDASDLVAADVSIDASGAARLEVHATRKLSVDSSGASKVTYHGRPDVSSNVSGAARVSPAHGRVSPAHGGGASHKRDHSFLSL